MSAVVVNAEDLKTQIANLQNLMSDGQINTIVQKLNVISVSKGATASAVQMTTLSFGTLITDVQMLFKSTLDFLNNAHGTFVETDIQLASGIQY